KWIGALDLDAIATRRLDVGPIGRHVVTEAVDVLEHDLRLTADIAGDPEDHGGYRAFVDGAFADREALRRQIDVGVDFDLVERDTQAPRCHVRNAAPGQMNRADAVGAQVFWPSA